MSDSVGRVQLDIEFSPESIVRETNSIAKTFSSGMKSTFTRMTGFVKDSMAKMSRDTRSIIPGEAMQAPNEFAEKIESLGARMENASNQAEMYRQKLKELAHDYELLDAASKKGVFGEQLREDMLKTEERMLRYAERSDKLRLEIEKLEQATAQLEQSTTQAGQTSEKAGKQIDKAGKKAQKSKNAFVGAANSIQKAFMRVLKQVFVFAVLYKVIRGFLNYMGSALKTNQAFSNSLAQVKTNLQVAFMPIYQAILPALQTLMRWLAVATTYIAAFISALFGKTYKQSFAAAQGLDAAKKGMDGYGKAAKKTLGALAGFDEINLLGGPEPEADTGGGGDAGDPGLVAPPVDTTAFEASMAGMRERFFGFFQSLKAWWQKEGAVMFAPHREALQNLWEKTLIPIKDFVLYDYYLPIGQAALSTLVPIFADVIPWAIGETGKRWLWLADVANQIWETIIRPVYTLIRNIVVDTLGIISDLWNTHGKSILTSMSKTMATLRGLWDQLWTKILKPIIIPFWEMLQQLWDDHLKDLLKQVGDFVLKMIQGAMDLYNGFIAPIVSWLIDLLAPKVKFAFAAMRDVIETVIGVVSDVLKGFLRVLGGVIDFIVGIFTGDWERAWTGIKDIVLGIWDMIWGGIKGVINLIIDMINSMLRGFNQIKIDVPDWKVIPAEYRGKSFGINIPLVPKLARGGIVDQPTLAMIGEKRKKEAVVPLEDTSFVDKLAAAVASAVLAAMQFSAGSGQDDSGSREIVIEIDGTKLARVLLPKTDSELQRLGARSILQPV